MKEIHIGLGGFSILQGPNNTHVQMMSYVIKTPAGKLLVIDGGNTGDADYLRRVIQEGGGHVDIWLITHCHDDHYSALIEILNDPQGITVDKVYYNFPPQTWLDSVEPGSKPASSRVFGKIEELPELFCVVYEGNSMTLDGMKIEVLNDPMDFQRFTEPPSNDGSNINDTSLVFRLTFPNGKTAMFLGDLGLHAGDIFAEKYGEKLKSDIVQMAHHGQNGAGENVYKLIRPEVCMWAAPMWLYNNDGGNGFNTHIYKTVTVRGWMEKLGVKYHAVEGEGPTQIF